MTSCIIPAKKFSWVRAHSTRGLGFMSEKRRRMP
eukprot:CAMPEP_0206607032 /NCGR_PEP_ID=MMETSP0325_2-20121206/51833_1 /ASSEMBLY_ACC=CAM_ASM_000347 /TAXON_ID=2866 /ORGANISM="Crypthecodinium cohnii, Strain Seligo" /LENGTH=33 /DNA_ID= /DNA_START= /DNA_END= /DNA_ORIENTATION=